MKCFTKRKQHYQLTGSHLSRLCNNVKNLVVMVANFGVIFNENESVFNLISKAVLTSKVADGMLTHKTIGAGMYNDFIEKRFHGEESVWSPMKKRKLMTFASQGKIMKSKVEGKVIQLKEEKSLIARFLITSHKRPELDLEYCLGNFEFSVVPKALFSTDGEPLPCTDKSKILHHIEDLGAINKPTDDDNLTITDVNDDNRVIVIDGMAVVNQIHKSSDMKTCKVSLD